MSQFNHKNLHLVVGGSILFQLVMWINFIPVSSIWQILYSLQTSVPWPTRQLIRPCLHAGIIASLYHYKNSDTAVFFSVFACHWMNCVLEFIKIEGIDVCAPCSNPFTNRRKRLLLFFQPSVVSNKFPSALILWRCNKIKFQCVKQRTLGGFYTYVYYAAFPFCNGQSLNQKAHVSCRYIASHIRDPAAQIIQENSKPSAHLVPDRNLTSHWTAQICNSSAYSAICLAASRSATFPAHTAASLTQEGANVSATVMSHVCISAFSRDDGRTIKSQATVAESDWFLYGCWRASMHGHWTVL